MASMPEERLFLIDQNFISQSLLISSPFSVADVIDRCNLEDCQINIIDPRYLIMVESRFIRCSFMVKRSANNLIWRDNYFESCTFLGRYKDVTFGRVEKNCKVETGLKNCDFSQARLHLVMFYKANVESCQFPSWPHFTLLYPQSNIDDWLSIPFPKEFQSLRETAVGYEEGVVAFTMNWSDIARAKMITADPEEIRALLAAKPYIRL